VSERLWRLVDDSVFRHLLAYMYKHMLHFSLHWLCYYSWEV